MGLETQGFVDVQRRIGITSIVWRNLRLVIFGIEKLRLIFPRTKLRRQIFMIRAEVWAKHWAKNWAKISAHFRASFAVQNDPQMFSPNSSQFITPCLVAEILKFHLRKFLGFGGRNEKKMSLFSSLWWWWLLLLPLLLAIGCHCSLRGCCLPLLPWVAPAAAAAAGESSTCCHDGSSLSNFEIGGKYTPKVFSALKTQVPQQAKKRFGVYQKACLQGRKKENTYTPKNLQGVCGEPLRAVLVYRFWPPMKSGEAG